MGVLLEDSSLARIDAAKERIDARRIEDYVQLMHRDLMQEVIRHAPTLDEDNAARQNLVVKSFRNAWDYVLQKFNGSVDIMFLQDVAGRLEPPMAVEGKEYAQLRKGLVELKINGRTYVPPSDKSRILVALERVEGAAKDANLHPVEEALFYNLHLTRIQPFENANKRTANIIMNAILYKNGYFPVHLREQDVGPYKKLIGDAILGFRESAAKYDPKDKEPFIFPERNQKIFYNFLGSREASELSLAEDRLRGLHSYKIEFSGVKERGALFAAKNNIHKWFDSHGLPHQERLTTTGMRTLEVFGDIPRDNLGTLLRNIRGIGSFSIIDNGRH